MGKAGLTNRDGVTGFRTILVSRSFTQGGMTYMASEGWASLGASSRTDVVPSQHTF